MKFKHFALGAALTATAGTGGTVAVDQLVINPYTTNGTQLEIQASSTLADAGTEKIAIDTTQPKITLSKWNGEIQMGVTYTGMPGAKGGRPFLSKNVEWSQGTQKMEVVPLAASSTYEDGGYEINIILDAKPASNVFSFRIDGADQLEFYYQAPLWEQAGLPTPTPECTESDCHFPIGQIYEPDNVIGSYAVYYKDHRDHVVGDINYGTGKAFHIFRPKVLDAKGNAVWATLNYTQPTITVTVPEAFLENATYPIRIDPLFGYNTIGASNSVTASSDLTASNIHASYVYTATAGDTVTMYSIYGGSTGDAQMTVYACTAGGHPTNWLAAGTAVSIGAANAWNNSGTVSQALSGGTTYCVTYDDFITASWNVFLDNLSGNRIDISNDAALTSSWNALTFDTHVYSMYATYTAGGGGGASTPPSDDGQWFQLFP